MQGCNISSGLGGADRSSGDATREARTHGAAPVLKLLGHAEFLIPPWVII